MEDGPTDEEEDKSHGADTHGEGEGLPRSADEGGPSGLDEVGDGVVAVDPADESIACHRVDDGGGIHRKLSNHADGAGDVGIKEADGSEETAEGGSQEHHGEIGHGEEDDGPGREETREEEDRDEEDQADGRGQGGLTDAGEDGGNAGEIELDEHASGSVERHDRLGQRFEKGLPEQGSDHDKGGVGHAGVGHLDHPGGIEEEPDQSGGNGRKEKPGVAKDALAELGLEVAVEEGHREFAGVAQFVPHLPKKAFRVRECGIGGVDRDGEIPVFGDRRLEAGGWRLRGIL